ncbi:MAG TPA: hypothetical protein VHF69_04425 [Candidatus Synoicihabitans sp.]|nr:hypothetical protein [Candidatus Synoicihabitans sp.]
MIRVLAGSAGAALAVGLAGSFVAPTLSGIPHGEPMLVAGSDSTAALQKANFSEAACAARLLLAEDSAPEDVAGMPPVSIVVLAVRAGTHGFVLAIEELAPDAAVPDGTLIFALTPDGDIVGMWDAAHFRSGEVLASRCDQKSDATVAGSI